MWIFYEKGPLNNHTNLSEQLLESAPLPARPASLGSTVELLLTKFVTVSYRVKKGKEKEVSFSHPKGLGEWYQSIGQGMGKTLTYADEKQAYTLADRGTYIKYKFGRDVPIELDVLCEGDPMLANPYGLIPINPKKHPHVKHKLAEEFAQWLVSKRGQAVIADYRLLDKQLFYPDVMK